ncbi:MAG: Gfo/Idh/MocA family oxidoreductase [Lentisphaeria bacterium]|nr:Gfo/Idh/MocA family oxidoreductase [Lentisphaeria bacterium]
MAISSDRRQFLARTGSAAAGLLAAPWILPAGARGADGAQPPSERLSLGFIGMGKMCWGHLGSMLGRKDVHIAALCDVESIRLEKCRKRVDDTYAERYGPEHYRGCSVYRDFREMLARPDIDVIFIATPTNWHAVMSVEAMKAGKDVYCEKPLCLSIREGRAIVEAARRYNRIFQTGSQQRSDGKFRFACELVRNGRIGRVERIHINVGGPPQPCYLPAEATPPTLDWDLWVGPAPMRPYHHELCPLDDYDVFPRWRYYRDYGGGGMTDWGAHHFDIAQWALGMDASGPVEIIPPECSESRRLTYRYANGTEMQHGGATGEAGVEFFGTEGRIGVNRGFLKTEPEDLMRETWGPGDVRLYDSRNHQDNWIDCVRTRRPPICPPEVGHRTITVCLLGNIAYELKRPLRWDPEAEGFVDDALADRMRGRPLRAPWVV